MNKHRVQESILHWERLAKKELKDKPIQKLSKNTLEGIKFKSLYTEQDINKLNKSNCLA